MTGLIARVGVCGAAAWLSIGLWSGNAFSQTAAGAADKPLPSPSSVQGSNVSPSHGASTKVSEKHQLIVTQDY
ncbi:MAG: hypothetical protein ACRENW_09105, partial [Thermodesulfobacteriota bacterium]